MSLRSAMKSSRLAVQQDVEILSDGRSVVRISLSDNCHVVSLDKRLGCSTPNGYRPPVIDIKQNVASLNLQTEKNSADDIFPVRSSR